MKVKQPNSGIKKLLLVSCIFGVAVFIGYVTSPKNKSIDPEHRPGGDKYADLLASQPNSPSTSDVSTLPLEIGQADQNDWTKVIVPPLANTTYSKFSISYPSSWTLEGKNNESFSIKKGSSVIGMDRPAVDGGVCLFSDTDMSKVDKYWEGVPIQKAFKEISVKHGVLRRYKLDNPNQNDNNIHYQICELYREENIFEVPMDGGIIGVTTSPNITDTDLREIDSILATYQYE